MARLRSNAHLGRQRRPVSFRYFCDSTNSKRQAPLIRGRRILPGYGNRRMVRHSVTWSYYSQAADLCSSGEIRPELASRPGLLTDLNTIPGRFKWGDFVLPGPEHSEMQRTALFRGRPSPV